MNVKCGCGGKFKRNDLKSVSIIRDGKPFIGVMDVSTEVASFKCNKCGAVRTQRKRRPAGPKS